MIVNTNVGIVQIQVLRIKECPKNIRTNNKGLTFLFPQKYYWLQYISIIRKFNINFKLVKITWRHLNLILQKVWLFFFRRWLNFQRRYFLPWSSIACFVSWRHLYCPEWREDNYPQTFSTIFSGINAVDKVGTHLGNVLAIRNSTRIHYCIHVTSIHTSNS